MAPEGMPPMPIVPGPLFRIPTPAAAKLPWMVKCLNGTSGAVLLIDSGATERGDRVDELRVDLPWPCPAISSPSAGGENHAWSRQTTARQSTIGRRAP